MTEKEVKKLLSRYRKGLCTEEELKAVDNWLERETSLGKWDISHEEKIQFGRSLKQRIDEERNKYTGDRTFPIKVWWYAAAGIVLFIGFGIYFLFAPAIPADRPISQYGADVLPGGNLATLTLANGRTINLENAGNGQIAEQNDIIISKTQDGQIVYDAAGESGTLSASDYNTVTVPKGGQYQVILSDGTKVLLNAQSSLKYPTHFTGEERTVELTGEGLFDVKQQKKQPFRVITKGQQITVLGTSFNVKAYSDETSIKTTLTSGAVEVSTAQHKLILSPSEQAVSDAHNLSKRRVDIHVETGWSKGDFIFDGEDLPSVLRTISRWYDIDIKYIGTPPTMRFGGEVSRSKSLSAILKMLENAGSVKFRIESPDGEERRLIVMP